MAKNGSTGNHERFLIESEDEETDTECGEEDIHELVVSFVEDSSDDEGCDLKDAADEWCGNIVVRNRWAFSDSYGVHETILNNCKEPIDFYKLFLNDEVLELIVRESNRYGYSRNMDWVPTHKDEIIKLIALALQMEIVRLPTLESYWSDDPVYGCHRIGPNAIPRYRFEELITNLHLCDNNVADGTDKLYKISNFLHVFNKVCQDALRPGQELSIDVSRIPLRGRIVSRKSIPSQKRSHDIELFKMLTRGGYTYRTIVHVGEQVRIPAGSVIDEVVIPLLGGLLDSGRVLFADSYCTSIPLAETLIGRKTNVVGALRRGSKGLPVTVTGQKLKKGEHLAQQKPSGVTILKWRGKKDVLMLSTMHDDSMNANGKLNIIEDYKEGKSLFDVPHQKTSYSPYIGTTTKWYQKIFFHLVTKTAIVNSWRLFCDVTGSQLELTSYKISIVKSLLPMKRPPSPTLRHILEQVEGAKRTTVRRCVSCYTRICGESCANEARRRAKRVNTRCSKCKRHFCIECFQVNHTQC